MKLLDKRGRLTRYGLSCGYVERFETPYFFLTLLMKGSTIFVRLYNRETGGRSESDCKTVREAYKLFNQLKKQVCDGAKRLV